MTKEHWKLTQAFHPLRFEKGVYAVSFHKPNQLLLDKYTRLFQVKAKNRAEAIKKARRLL